MTFVGLPVLSRLVAPARLLPSGGQSQLRRLRLFATGHASAACLLPLCTGHIFSSGSEIPFLFGKVRPQFVSGPGSCSTASSSERAFPNLVICASRSAFLSAYSLTAFKYFGWALASASLLTFERRRSPKMLETFRSPSSIDRFPWPMFDRISFKSGRSIWYLDMTASILLICS